MKDIRHCDEKENGKKKEHTQPIFFIPLQTENENENDKMKKKIK